MQSGNRNSMLVQFLPSPSLMVVFYLSFTDNELLYRTRDGDVVKLNADTKERTVIVPKQLFVSMVVLQRCWFFVVFSQFTSRAVSALSAAAVPGVLRLRVCF